jgi:hypothetical protein
VACAGPDPEPPALSLVTLYPFITVHFRFAVFAFSSQHPPSLAGSEPLEVRQRGVHFLQILWFL